MAELENEFSWSQSRSERLESCARAYYFQYYGKWNGWRSDAPEEARRAYRLSRMTNLDLFAGSVVHDVTESVLGGIRSGKPISLEEASVEARRKLNDGWTQSRERRWLTDPKRNVNLFEHYYRLQIERADTDRIRAKVLSCLENLYASEVLQRLRRLPQNAWLAVEELGHFHLDGVKIFAKPDVAARDEGVFFLFDWKTGKEGVQNDVQLAGYALYAVEKWAASVGSIETVLVYLKEGTVRASRPDESRLDRARAAIRASIVTMRDLLADPIRNVAIRDDFPMTEDRRECRRCFFQELCFPEGIR